MLCDCHMHMVLDGRDWKAALARHRDAPMDSYILPILEQYQKDGYTYLRDGGDRWGVGKRARQLAPNFGICYRTPLAPISKRGHYGGFIGTQFDSMQDFAALVRQAKQDGADFIKIMISGLMDFDCFGKLSEEGLSPEEIREMIAITKAEGFAVMAHANGAKAVLAAVEAGVDSVEHGAYLDPEALAAMAEKGTVWVPTVSTVANLRGTGRFSEKDVAAIFGSAAENLRTYAGLGGLIAVGSDAGAWAVPHGCNTEKRLLTEILGEKAWILDLGNATIQERF